MNNWLRIKCLYALVEKCDLGRRDGSEGKGSCCSSLMTQVRYPDPMKSLKDRTFSRKPSSGLHTCTTTGASAPMLTHTHNNKYLFQNHFVVTLPSLEQHRPNMILEFCSECYAHVLVVVLLLWWDSRTRAAYRKGHLQSEVSPWSS